MRPERRTGLTFLFWAACAGLTAIYAGWVLVMALGTGQIEGKHGHVYDQGADPGGFGAVFGIHLLIFVFSAAAAIYVMWVRPMAIRGEATLSRRLAVRGDLDSAVRAPLDPTGQSTDS